MKKTPLFFLLIFTSFNCFAQLENAYNSSELVSVYNNLDNWSAHPWSRDFSDSIPLAIINKETRDSSVDVFFIHPTTYTKNDFSNWNAELNDEVLNNKTDESAILYQASVFNASCRIFAPRYRQAHIKSFYIDKETAKPYFDIDFDDIKNAIEYYLSNYNNGRPIIIAGHSQGTVHAARLLKTFFDDKPLGKRLVAAYLIGMPIPLNYFSSIDLCKNKNQTGCYVSWRTYYKGYEPSEEKNNNKIVYGVVNPLNWEAINHQYVSKQNNKGAVMRNFNKVVKNVVDAEIHNNILWSCKPDVFGKIFFNKKNFHIGDINLFYINIRENIKDRIENYFKSN
jgi:pimeloyl-ACP methyl ester carboxylesterase